MSNDRWLSVDEIAAHLGVKKSTVYMWTHMDRIPCHRIGKLLRFNVVEVDKWVKSGKASRK